MNGSHVNVKVAASFNLYVYARHTTLCLYYARKICFTSVRTENYATVEIHRPQVEFLLQLLQD